MSELKDVQWHMWSTFSLGFVMESLKWQAFWPESQIQVYPVVFESDAMAIERLDNMQLGPQLDFVPRKLW